MEIWASLRELAKTNYYQTVYGHSKDFNLKLFKNEGDYTDFQIRFLNFLSTFSSVQTDVALGDVDEKVLNDETYQDAWIYYKNRKNDKKKPTTGKPEENLSGNSWVFKRPNKK